MRFRVKILLAVLQNCANMLRQRETELRASLAVEPEDNEISGAQQVELSVDQIVEDTVISAADC